MGDIVKEFLFGGAFMPHGHCYYWTKSLVVTHVASDATIFLAYMTIPITLVYFVRKRRDLPFSWMFICFGVFIVACGTTHLMEIWNVWRSAYWLSGSIKVITAIASIGTAALLVRLIPTALALPSPEMLRRKNDELALEAAERRKAQTRLETSLREKEALLKEVHHRVKNNLQVISSLLRIQSKFFKDKASIDMMRESENRVRSMALVHQKLYQTDDYSQIDFEDYLRSLTGELFSSYGVEGGRVVLKTEAESIPISADIAVPVGMIVSELLSNSLKHAFPGERTGEIRVALKQAGAMLALSVSDTGVGLPKDLDPQAAPSMGLQLVSALGKQIDATITTRREGGARFDFSFPATRLLSA